MAEHDSPQDVRDFETLALEEKMIQYERGLVTHPRKMVLLFQELIDDGRCWSKRFPHHTHYARMCAYYLRKTACHLHNASVHPPDEAVNSDYLYQEIYEGHDAWGRTPMEADWGRCLRWREVREGLIAKFEKNQIRKQQGLPMDTPIPKKKGCCGK
tara:strand:+ start:476 stop:943 length:468 start_codon:yes stop_codon:yes gene_type:complete